MGGDSASRGSATRAS
uniref:Uncharacterized protein n=1 Tax=Rhizophora mucronata TaxID=61149 RepID=A0A2P2JIE0_RHIMU